MVHDPGFFLAQAQLLIGLPRRRWKKPRFSRIPSWYDSGAGWVRVSGDTAGATTPPDVSTAGGASMFRAYSRSRAVRTDIRPRAAAPRKTMSAPRPEKDAISMAAGL